MYKDILDGTIDKNQVVNDIESDILTFIQNNFILSAEQAAWLQAIPQDVLTNIARNLAHSLENNYNININLGNLALDEPGIYSEEMINCRIGIGEMHLPGCQRIPTIRITCEF